MDSIDAARSFLDQQNNVAIWYAEYKGRDEYIRYANKCFSEAFDIPVQQILARGKYHLVNPPGTSEATIESYKDEDQKALDSGIFINRSPLQPGKDILVVKLRFDRGILGLFKTIESDPVSENITLKNMEPEIHVVIQKTCPDLV